jgi:hypothetical protein
MMQKFFLLIFLFTFSLLNAQVKVEDFYKKSDGKDLTPSIQRAFNYIDSVGHGSVEFDGTKDYIISSSLELPRYRSNKKRTIIINGNGCNLTATAGITIFKRVPIDQKEALDKMMATRFVISDFTFTGGDRGIHLCATFGSVIQRCTFLGQKLASIEVQFGLATEIHHCLITNPAKDGIILACGQSWGGNAVNSQSNHSIISMCRVYSAKGSESSFKILGSSGVVLRDIISEGSHETKYAVYFDRQGSTVVRLFRIENFHLEHAPQSAAIYLNHTGIATIDGLFYQHAHPLFRLVEAAAGAEQVTLKNVPHFVKGTILYSGNNEIPWRLEFCSKEFYLPENWIISSSKGEEKKLPFYFSGVGSKYHLKKTY